MKDRRGQVWWARKNSFTGEFEPCVILDVMDNTGPFGVWWKLYPIERLGGDSEEFGQYEADFRHVESGRDHAWLKSRIE